MSIDEFSVPESCPKCGHTLVDEGSFLYCYNKNCPARASGSISTWIDRLGLLYWGDALVSSLTSGDTPPVSSVADLYKLTVEDISRHTSGLKYAQKCYDVLHSNKSVKLELVLSALNIPNLGISTATDLVYNGFDTISKLLGAKSTDFCAVPNIGSKTAESIVDGLAEKAQSLLELNNVISIEAPRSGRLSGRSFCITGATELPRKALQKQILDHGGIVKESVVSGLSYLISNESSSSSKSMKAAKFGIPIITESQLKDLIK